ncbi:MAG: 2-dehydro-3-deoxygalactonokinase, partial [Phyllobacterium sp.]
MKEKPVSIIVDWGTTSLRAALVSASGATIDSRETEGGIQFIKDGTFEATLMRATADWFDQFG